MTAARGAAFAAAVRVINRVHRHAAVVRLAAQVAGAARFAELDVFVVDITDLADSGLALDAHAAEDKDRLFAFCALPKFDITEKPVEENGLSLIEVTLAGKPLSYVARGIKPQQAEATRAYRQFADWCARLNATRGGNLPPGARLALNQALADRDLVPLQITRTIPAAGPFGKKLEVRSELAHG